MRGREGGRRVAHRLTGSFDSDEETATYERWRPALTPPTAEELALLPEGSSQADLLAHEAKTERIYIPGEDSYGSLRTWPGESLTIGGPHGLADLPATYARLSTEWEELGERTEEGRVLTGHRADVDIARLHHETYLDDAARAEAEGGISYQEKQAASPAHYEDLAADLVETTEVWLDADGHLVEATWTTGLRSEPWAGFETTYRFES